MLRFSKSVYRARTKYAYEGMDPVQPGIVKQSFTAFLTLHLRSLLKHNLLG